MNKAELMDALRRSVNYGQTHRLVKSLDEGTSFDAEEVRLLCEIALQNQNVLGTLHYKPESDSKSFYKKLLQDYDGAIAGAVERVWMILYKLDNQELYEFYKEQANIANERHSGYRWNDPNTGHTLRLVDGLYHANSVSTSLSYIRNQMLYSRAYGDEHFPEAQTGQWSDGLDAETGIYNDIFFDNCDIRSISGNHSVYGPVTFVFRDKILRKEELSFRIMKINPANVKNPETLPYEDLFFTCVGEMQEWVANNQYSFRTDFGHHTTMYNQPTFHINSWDLRYIILEKDTDDTVTERVKNLLRSAMDDAGLGEVPIIVRPNLANRDNVCPAAPWEELWRIPEE